MFDLVNSVFKHLNEYGCDKLTLRLHRENDWLNYCVAVIQILEPIIRYCTLYGEFIIGYNARQLCSALKDEALRCSENISLLTS